METRGTHAGPLYDSKPVYSLLDIDAAIYNLAQLTAPQEYFPIHSIDQKDENFHN